MAFSAQPPGAMRSPLASAELAHLLDHGPFAAALRAAIAANGLSLDRIQARLQVRGVTLSVATLSYWQSGRRRPARPDSLRTLGHLEAILRLPSGSLSSLLASHGRDCPPQHVTSLQELWSLRAAAATSLSELAPEADSHLRRLSQYDHVTVGRDQHVRLVRSEQVMRATEDGVDRWLLVFDPCRTGGPRSIVTNLRHCRLGRILTLPGSELVAAELLFGRPLWRGETQLLAYEIRPQGGISTTPPHRDRFQRRFREPVREYVVEVAFDPSALPGRCHHLSSGAGPNPVRRTTALVPNTSATVHAVGMDLDPGVFGIHWQW